MFISNHYPLPCHTRTHTHTWVPLPRKTEASEGKLCSFPQNLPLPVCYQHGDSMNVPHSVCRSHMRTPCMHRWSRVCCVLFIWGSREDLGECVGREQALHTHCRDAKHGPPRAGVKGTSHFLYTLSSSPPSPSPGTSSGTDAVLSSSLAIMNGLARCSSRFHKPHCGPPARGGAHSRPGNTAGTVCTQRPMRQA